MGNGNSIGKFSKIFGLERVTASVFNSLKYSVYLKHRNLFPITDHPQV